MARTRQQPDHEHVHDHVNVYVDVQVLVDEVVFGFCPRLGGWLKPVFRTGSRCESAFTDTGNTI